MNDSPVDCQNVSVTEPQRDPPRPYPLRKLFCFGADSPGGLSLQKNLKFSVGAIHESPVFICGYRSFRDAEDVIPYNFSFFVSAFLKGVRGDTFFAKKVPPAFS